MKLTYYHFILVLLGSILSFSSCKKEQTTNEEPYSSITNLSTIAVSNSNVYYCEPVKTLSIEDGYLMLTNVHYDNGDIGIQYNKLNRNQEVVWSQTYSDGGYQCKGVDLIQAQNNVYIAMNFGLDLGESTRIKLLRIDMNGNIMQEKSIPSTVTSHSYYVHSIAYEEGDDLIDPSLILTGETTNIDILKPDYTENYDLKDIYVASLNPNLEAESGIYWERYDGYGNNDKGMKVITQEDGYLIGGLSKGVQGSSADRLILVKGHKESNNILNTQLYTISNLNLEWIDMVEDTDRQQFHLFAYDPNATTATVYKISTDKDFNQIGDTDIINLVDTEPILYHSVNLLSNGLFLLTLEKSNNENTQNIEWVTFTINGAFKNRYTLNDPEQKYTESVGRLSEVSNKTLSIDRLLFPITYQNNRNIGAYQLDLNFPIQN
ncbi:MAG: hypothetical protein MK212_20090 [Saprospiraceae bacterium]|nr:hypothetical protein [Saprospiraceae bacterium]